MMDRMTWPLLESPLWGSISLVVLWLAAVLLLAEGLYRRGGAGPELARKIVHIGTGNVIFLAWGLAIPAWVGCGAAIAAAIVAIISYRLPILPSVNGVGRKSFGTLFYALSIGGAIAIFWPLGRPEYAALGVGIMAWGDGLAALVGQAWGRHPYHIAGNTKSWEGSLTMLGVSFGLGLGVLGLAGGAWPSVVVVAGLVAIAATALEAFSLYGLDNLTVPLGTAAIAYALQQGFQQGL